jgi:hypothetical protein
VPAPTPTELPLALLRTRANPIAIDVDLDDRARTSPPAVGRTELVQATLWATR